MRIAQISTWDVACGIAGYTKGLVNGILQHGITCTVVPIEEQKLKYMTRGEIKEYFNSYSRQLIDYDIIHIQHEFSFFAGSYGLNGSITNFNSFLKGILNLNKKVFVTFHTEPSFLLEPSYGLTGFGKKIIRKLQWEYYMSSLFNFKNQLNAIVHTKKTRRIFLDSGFADNSVHIIKQGVTFSHTHNINKINGAEKIALKKKLGFPDEAIILSMFGFISTYKGYKTALNALKSLPENYYLVITGTSHPNSTDNALDEIVQFINKYQKHKNLGSRIKLTGYLEFEDLRSYYDITDFCLAPYEPTTILSSSAALTWALSSGKPVIASKIASFEELNEEANCLHLFTPGAPGELAYKIQNLTLSTELNQQLVANGLIYCEANQWLNIAKKHLEIYEGRKF
ncbi:MAG: glycosyltransferase [Nostoc sp. CmiVER01]|uniref:glycosyltransferase n=1 Tax=Nostoc sp. CmiVER01 TaxID=3075384 RepID=UPI002AD28D33|nr:glycosyltransferase [Nostoc sp. CmiVER01]MDZ8122426.1 glycosyltransferase [Nostoc sp. CmiVER01]